MTGPSSADERDLLRRLLALSERGTAAIQQILAVLHESNAEIAALRERARQLEQQARDRPGFEDETDLYNARGFQFELAREEARARRFGTAVAVVWLRVHDLDTITQRFGAEAGEALAIRIGEALRHRGRGADVVARQGAGEFVVLLLGATFTGAQAYLDRLRAVPITLPLPDGSSFAVHFRAGVATRDEAGSLSAAVTAARERATLDRERVPP